MKRMLMERENIPCWCGMSFRDNPLGIAVTVHNEIANLLRNERIISCLKEEFDFQTFSKIADEGESFGFDRAGVKKDAGDFVEIFFTIPRIDIMTDDPCMRCKGTGKDSYFKGSCSSCEGTGKEIRHEYQSLYALSASLSVLFMDPQMYSPDKETTSNLKQLIALDFITSKSGQNGFGGVWSAAFCNYLRWLYKNPVRLKEVTDEATKAMQAVFNRCYYRKNPRYDFWVRVGENACLLISCFGDRCRVCPSPSRMALPGEGCEFFCKNVDTPVQMTALAAALFSMHDNARRDMGHY